MEIIKVRITGTRPMLMHSDRLADPLDPIAKQRKMVTDKTSKKKTEDDHAFLAKTEWIAALYFDDELGPVIPGRVIEGMLIESARIRRLGKQFERSVETMEQHYKLEYKGPREVEKLWEAGFRDVRSVVMPTGGRVMRYRPIFREWACTFDVAYEEEMTDRETVIDRLNAAGRFVGIGDYRPRFGRFDVEIL